MKMAGWRVTMKEALAVSCDTKVLAAVCVAAAVLSCMSSARAASHFQQGFVNTSVPSGWSDNAMYYNSTANHGTFTGGNGAGFNATADWLESPQYDTAGTLTFWIRGSSSPSSIEMTIQKKIGAGSWTDLVTYPSGTFSSTWEQRSIDINDSSSSISIRWYITARSGNSIYLDDIELTDYAGAPTVAIDRPDIQPDHYVTAGASDEVILWFRLSPSASIDFTGLSVNMSGDATGSDLSNFEVVYDADNSGTYNVGDSIVSDSAQAFGNPVVFDITGQTGFDTARSYLVIVDIAGGATVGHLIAAGISATDVITTGTESGDANGPVEIIQAAANSTLSDIIRDSGFSEPANIAYSAYQEADLTAASLQVASFTIRDGGAGAPDGDSVATTLTDIQFTVAGGANLRRVALYDGSTEIAEVVGGTTVAFSSLSGLAAADDGSKTLKVLASFNASVTDNQQLQFTITSATADSGGSTFAAADAGGAASDTTGDANRIEVTATKLAFTAQDTACTVDQDFTATVRALDANDNIDLDNTASVTLAKAGGNGTLSSASGLTQSLTSGGWQWNDLRMDTAGSFTIAAADTPDNLTDATSAAITATALLAAGDIAIIGMDTGSEDFSFVTFVTLAAGTQIYFTDEEADGDYTIGTGEGTVLFTAPGGGIAAGTVVSYVANAAYFSLTSDGNITLGNSGDGLIAYRGASVGNVDAFLHAVAKDSVTLGTFPDGFSNYVLMGTDDGQYSGTRSGTVGVLMAAVNEIGNWTTANDGVIPFDTTAFTLISLDTEPTTQATAIQFANIAPLQMDVSWTSGDGDGRLVICREGGAPSGAPSDGITYTADSDFSGSGSSLGDGKVVYAGADAGFTLTGLTPSTTYHLQVFEYNNLGGAINYFASTASGNPASQASAASANSAASDIVRQTAFSEPDNVDYAAYQAADITGTGDSIELARFSIRDGGAAGTDSDGESTTLTDLTLSIVGSANLRRVALYDGATEIAEAAAGASVVFSSLTGLAAADEGTKDVSVRATFQSSVTDNAQLSFTITAAAADAAGSTFAAADAGGAASATTGDDNRIEVTASLLAFSAVDTSVAVDTAFSATVVARDANGNLDLDATPSVTITKATGPGVLTGGDAQSLTAGSASWAALQLDAAGSYTLTAAGGGLTDATSPGITVSVSAQAFDVIVNEMSQGSGGGKEWVELLVLAESADLRGWELGDNDDGVWHPLVTFSSDSAWASVARGTLIVVYNGGDVDGTISAPDTDFADKSVVIPSDNATYFSSQTTWGGTTGGFANSDADDGAAIRDASDNIVHDMPYTHVPADTATVPAPGSGNVKSFLGDSTVKLIQDAYWLEAVSTAGTPGLPNGGLNATWITALRGTIDNGTIFTIR